MEDNIQQHDVYTKGSTDDPHKTIERINFQFEKYGPSVCVHFNSVPHDKIEIVQKAFPHHTITKIGTIINPRYNLQFKN